MFHLTAFSEKWKKYEDSTSVPDHNSEPHSTKAQKSKYMAGILTYLRFGGLPISSWRDSDL
ncbi:hypothetical protein CLV59_105112 [Chitinophaga dinghuensis]|uniref:Uncharacterized protein n=1 Tax=Chitinophaga dinghuensis TaxID=1539050 RepID=A0A327VYJ8_9BACT|nr:hypothetical protein CLV59_105112 [Chitinophaga dinghuensis]